MLNLKEFSEIHEVDLEKIQRENIDRDIELININIRENQRIIEILENLRAFTNHSVDSDLYKPCDCLSKHYRRYYKKTHTIYQAAKYCKSIEHEQNFRRIEKMDDNIIILNDDEGNEVAFEFLDLIEYLNNEYVVLLPVNDDADQVVILQLEESSNDEESYIGVENENIVNAVFEIFKEKHKDTFNFED